MAKIPLEIIGLADKFSDVLERSISLANQLQNQISIELVPHDDFGNLEILRLKELEVTISLDEIQRRRKEIRGFHPYIVVVTDAYLYSSDLHNLFSSVRPTLGLGLLTIHGVADLVIPKDRMETYLLYNFARYILNYFNPNQRSHDDTRGCLYDTQISKIDILKSMKKNAFCDECKRSMFSSQNSLLTGEIFEGINKLLVESEKILKSVKITESRNNEVFQGLTIDDVRKYISEGQIIKAIELIENKYVNLVSADIQDTILIVKTRINTLNKHFYTGTLALEEYLREKNKITRDLLYFLGRM